MPRVHVDHWIEDFIQAHARTTSKEIYGWLVGHETAAGDLLVVSAIACERYTTQHEVGARPDVREIQELASALPQGIGFVGIYHSHPGEVFHSSTDDETALSMARLYPRVLSAVTNGSITRWYRHEGGKRLVEFDPAPSFDAGGRLQLIRVEANVQYALHVDPGKPIITQVSSRLMDGFRAAWPGAVVEFCRVSPGVEAGAGPMMTVPAIAGSAAPRATKVEKSVAVADLPSKQLKFADERMLLARVQLSIKDHDVDRVLASKPIAGSITLDGIVGNVAGTLDAAVFARQLEAEIMDDLMVKTARSIALDAGVETTIVPPMTRYLPYLAIPLKLRIQTEAGAVPGVASVAAARSRDREMVAAMIKRAGSMLSSGRVALGRAMIAVLKEVAVELAEHELAKRCDALLVLAAGLEKQHDG